MNPTLLPYCDRCWAIGEKWLHKQKQKISVKANLEKLTQEEEGFGVPDCQKIKTNKQNKTNRKHKNYSG